MFIIVFMEFSQNNELNFVFKINKITNLLNHVDIYYQKEILKDIKKYNNQINNALDSQNFDDEEIKKNTMYNYLNKYLDNIINDQIGYLIESYHKDNKNQIMIDAEKKAIKSLNLNNQNDMNNNIDKSVNNIKNNFYKNVNFEGNQDINNLLNNKINLFFNQIKDDLLYNVKNIIDKKLENNWSDNNVQSSTYIQKKIKEFLKLFLKNDKVYNNIVEQMNNEINNIYENFNKFKNQQTDLELLIQKYITNNEEKINSIEKTVCKKINLDLENKIKLLTNIFNDTMKTSIDSINNNFNYFNNSKLNEQQIIKNIENKILNNNNFSKNNFDIKFNKENNEMELYYFKDIIASTKMNIKGLIGPKGPQGVKGDQGDITIIRNIEVNPDETIKFTMQNGMSIYEVNTENKLPKGPRGEKGNIGQKGDPGDVNINLKWNQDNVMKVNKENFDNLIFLKSLSIGENSHCLKNESLSIGKSICYNDNSISIGKNAKTLDSNSIAFFGNTIGKNAFSYLAEDVDENCMKFGHKEHNKYNIDNISLKAKEIILDCDELILKDNNFKNNKIVELEEKIEFLTKEINKLKK